MFEDDCRDAGPPTPLPSRQVQRVRVAFAAEMVELLQRDSAQDPAVAAWVAVLQVAVGRVQGLLAAKE